MSRRKAAPKRYILPDPLFKSEKLAKFMNIIMRDGKKSVAEKIVYGALDQVVATMISKSASAAKVKSDDESGGLAAALKKVNGGIHDCENARIVAIDCFSKALDKLMPSVEVRSRRVGGSTYQVPVEIRASRRMALAMRWLNDYSNKRGEKTMVARLSGEILDAMSDRGNAFKKKEDVHRMARANQAFAHYRW